MLETHSHTSRISEPETVYEERIERTCTSAISSMQNQPSSGLSTMIPATARRTLRHSIIRPDQTAQWQQALKDMDGKTRFLGDTWIPLLESVYGYEAKMVTLSDGDELVAALPFVVVSSPFTGKRGISLPFFDQCRSFSPNPENYQELYDFFIEYGRNENWDYIELRGDFKKLTETNPSISFYSHVIDLRNGPEKVFKQMASSAQRAVRKGRREGVVVTRSQERDEIVETFYDLQCITRKRHGLPPQPIRFFKRLHEQLIAKGKGSVFTARHEGKPIASSVYLIQDDIIHYKYGASDHHYPNLRSNNLVMWTALEYYSTLGFKELHLGRNSLANQGLRKYKLSLGSVENTTHYHRFDLKKNTIRKMSDDAFGWHNRFFSKLPIPLARLAGNLLYKHIA